MTGRRLSYSVNAIVFDVGETLVDETRLWTAWAREAGVTPLTMMGVLGSLIERGEDHRRVWGVLGVQAPRRAIAVEQVDLYPDALECLEAARRAGVVVGIAGNQPVGVVEQLSGLGFAADFVGSSAEWGVAKPARGFFERVAAASGVSPAEVLYVGDRLDNDILPARQLGMRTAFLRRGPWGHLQSTRKEAALADISLASLADLTAMLRSACTP